MEEKVLNTLTSKVNELMQKYEEMCDANEALRNELVSAKAQNEAKSNQITTPKNFNTVFESTLDIPKISTLLITSFSSNSTS